MNRYRRPLAALLLALLAATALAQTEYETLRQPAMRRLGARLQAGQEAAARRELSQYVARYPGDAVMRYNLACLTALAGDTRTARAMLDTALAAGYRDLDRILNDPDLSLLADDPELQTALEEHKAALVTRMNAGAFFLEEGHWSEPMPLRPDRHVPGPQAPSGSVRFRYDQAGLTAEVAAPVPDAHEILLCVALPRSLEEFETTRWFEFRADLARTGETVARLGRHGRRDPAARAGTLARQGEAWQVRIPWSSLHPYRPPVELLLGLNAVVRQRIPEAPAARWALIRDPYLASGLTPWRRFVPADLDPGLDAAAALVGRLATYLVVGDSLSVEFGIQGCPAGPADLALHAAAGGALADTTLAVELEADLAYVTVDHGLGDLPAVGWFDVGADLALADGRRLTWSDRGFRLPPDWFLTQQSRLESLPEAEQPLVQYQLFRVLRGQQSFQPHDDPTAVAVAVLAAESLLAEAEDDGSVLPDGAGLVAAAFPTGGDALQSCQLVLPAAARRRGAELVAVFTADRDLTRALADALAGARPAADGRLFLVATAPAIPGQAAAAASLVGDALVWAGALLQPGSVRLVGVGVAAEVVLHALQADPALAPHAQLLADADFDPWPLSQPEAVARLLAMSLADHRLVLDLPAAAGPRTLALAEALAAGGLQVERAERPADGGGPPVWAARILAGP